MFNKDSTQLNFPIKSVNHVAIIDKSDSLKKALDAMTRHKIGICVILNHQKKLEAVLTDGDLRRLLLSKQKTLPALLITPAIEFASRTPLYLTCNSTLGMAIETMKKNSILDLPVVNEENTLLGVFHIHDALE